MARLGVRALDLDERFVRSSGPGGQHVNKVSTCVVLTHRPSGISVRCQESRAQGMNRLLARQWLVEKLEARQVDEARRRQQAMEKLRRQKRRRSHRAKERMLALKRHRAVVKERRKRVSLDE